MHSEAALDHVRAAVTKFMAEHNIPSERDLAIKAGLEQSTLHRFLSRKTHQLAVDNLMKLAAYMGLTVSDLLGETVPDSYRTAEVSRAVHAMESLPPSMQRVVADLAFSLTRPEDNTKT